MSFNILMRTSGALDCNSLVSHFNTKYNSQVNISANTQTINHANNKTMSVNNQPKQTIVKMQPIKPSNSLSLKKGQKIVILDSNNNQVQNIRLGMGWKVKNTACELNTSAFMLDSNGKVIGDDWFVFYGQLNSPDKSVQHSGDNNGSNNDNETITIDLNKINPAIQKIVFVITIHEAFKHNLNFSMVSDAYIRIINANINKEFARFELTDYYNNVASTVVGEIYKHNGVWKFGTVGNGLDLDLPGLCARYGVDVTS